MKSKKFVVYVCDTETTGLQSDRHEIIELSLYRLSDDTQKTWFLKPKNPDASSPEALRVNGHKIENLKGQTKFGVETYMDPAKALIEIENWIAEDCVSAGDRIFTAQNAMFDIQFVEALWKNNGVYETFPFGQRPLLLDTKQIALFLDLCFDTPSEFYSLGNLVQKYGVKKEKAHSSACDTRMCKNVLLAEVDVVRQLIKNQ